MIHLMMALALAQSPAVLQSQKDGFPLLGQLYFEDGAETAIVEIELRDANDSTVLDRTTSNPAGGFHFNNVKVGRYWVVIEGERYQWIKHRLQVDVLTFGVINLELSLLPRRVSEHGEDVVSLEELRRSVPPVALEEFDKALKDFGKKDSRKGIERLEKALDIAPDFYAAYLQLGFAHQRNGRREEAIPPLEHAARLNTASAEARTWLGRLFFETEQFEKAIDVLTERLDLGASTYDDHFHLGSAYYKLGTPDEAEQNLLRAVELSPEEAGPARLQLYNVYMRTRRPGQALEQLDAWIERFTDDPNYGNIKEMADRLRREIGC